MLNRFVIFGATGDLTARLLVPALAQLGQEDAWPPALSVLGLGRKPWTTGEFRSRMASALKQFAPAVAQPVREDLVGRLDYLQADVQDSAGNAQILAGERQPLLAYLALPPGQFAPTIQALGAAKLAPGSLVAIEKPFGHNLASARSLNDLLARHLPDIDVYRVDHFLSDELLSRVFALRFANRLFEPVWNARHIERITIFWNETLTLEGRASYYDTVGHYRDVVQNHLLEAMALVAMEAPARRDEQAIRDARVNLFRAIPALSTAEIQTATLRARYTAGRIGDRAVPAYVDEPGVDPKRQVETFAAVILRVENWRWSGTPFVLSSGKALGENAAEIVLRFRQAPGLLFPDELPQSNVLRLGLMAPSLRLSINDSRPDGRLRQDDLTLTLPVPIRTAHAHLLASMLARDLTLAIRSDEVEELWRISDSILEGWERNEVPLGDYAAGSNGPDLAPLLRSLSSVQPASDVVG